MTQREVNHSRSHFARDRVDAMLFAMADEGTKSGDGTPYRTPGVPRPEGPPKGLCATCNDLAILERTIAGRLCAPCAAKFRKNLRAQRTDHETVARPFPTVLVLRIVAGLVLATIYALARHY